MHGNRKLICGVWVNDADYVVKKTSYLTGKYVVLWQCPYFSRWIGIIDRCYNIKTHQKQPTYAGCLVEESWKIFSNFKSWMINQDWSGKDIDKDLLFQGNKTYGPETCCFIDEGLNVFIADKRKHGLCMTGVTFNRGKGMFEARCNNPFKKQTEYLGVFDKEISAHLAWKARKHHFSCIYADMQPDERISAALRVRYV